MYVKVVDGSRTMFGDVVNDAILQIKTSARGEDHIPVVLDIKYLIDDGHLYAFIEWDYVWPCEGD